MPQITLGGDFFTVAQAAALLGVSIAAANHLVDTNEVESIVLIHAMSIRSRLGATDGAA